MQGGTQMRRSAGFAAVANAVAPAVPGLAQAGNELTTSLGQGKAAERGEHGT